MAIPIVLAGDKDVLALFSAPPLGVAIGGPFEQFWADLPGTDALLLVMALMVRVGRRRRSELDPGGNPS